MNFLFWITQACAGHEYESDDKSADESLDEAECHEEFAELFPMCNFLGDEDETTSSTSDFDSTSSTDSSTSDEDEANRNMAAKNALKSEQGQLNSSKTGLNSSKNGPGNKKSDTSLTRHKKNRGHMHNHSKLKSTHNGTSSSSTSATVAARPKEASAKSSLDSFFDSLDATIDSVARNFGTPGHQKQENMDSTTDSPTLNKSVTLCSPLSVTAISSPSSSQSPSTMATNQQQQQSHLQNKLNSPLVAAMSPASGAISPTAQNKRRPSLSSVSVGSPLKSINPLKKIDSGNF